MNFRPLNCPGPIPPNISTYTYACPDLFTSVRQEDMALLFKQNYTSGAWALSVRETPCSNFPLLLDRFLSHSTYGRASSSPISFASQPCFLKEPFSLVPLVLHLYSLSTSTITLLPSLHHLTPCKLPLPGSSHVSPQPSSPPAILLLPSVSFASLYLHVRASQG